MPTANTSTALDQFHAGAVSLAITKAKDSDLLIMLTAKAISSRPGGAQIANEGHDHH
jgi:hypothetical protein